ncbi:sugar phosphate isomerase/epimerase family protein [Streptomyces millisiae]|uniref:Sugar phosphate isomerase/epimerase family protein n=1 Tax=Streptomyces millisiae TaxID=3075542 RepID=A0ABU2LI57_9ACTN|nr:sugar phosphate isomerase/epimerase family protein [Streptomyces sp. DSM 44918]MDT0317274.1 sugar phosphate isomerase/epimerase family protein [Streptomyces sp. DSM 44918]
MPFSAQDWPIGAALLQFPEAQDAPAARWAGTLYEVAAAGFTHVDLTDTWVRPGDLTAERRRKLAGELKEAGLGVTAISTVRHSVIDPDGERAEENLAYLLRTVEAAAELGVGTVSVGLHRELTERQRAAVWFWTEPGASDPVGDERVWRLAVERLRRVGEHAAGLGVAVSLEMYEDTYLGTAESAVRLVREIDLPNVGLNPDIGNLVRLHRPVEDWERIMLATAPYTNYWHIKNYYRDHDPATGAYFTVPAPAESGFVDYRRAVEIALAAGFAGPICVEHYGGDGLSVSATNREYLRRVLAAKLRGGAR